jgi:hypothetical protein
LSSEFLQFILVLWMFYVASNGWDCLPLFQLVLLRKFYLDSNFPSLSYSYLIPNCWYALFSSLVMCCSARAAAVQFLPPIRRHCCPRPWFNFLFSIFACSINAVDNRLMSIFNCLSSSFSFLCNAPINNFSFESVRICEIWGSHGFLNRTSGLSTVHVSTLSGNAVNTWCLRARSLTGRRKPDSFFGGRPTVVTLRPDSAVLLQLEVAWTGGKGATEAGTSLRCGAAPVHGEGDQRISRSLYSVLRKVWCQDFNCFGRLNNKSVWPFEPGCGLRPACSPDSGATQHWDTSLYKPASCIRGVRKHPYPGRRCGRLSRSAGVCIVHLAHTQRSSVHKWF